VQQRRAHRFPLGIGQLECAVEQLDRPPVLRAELGRRGGARHDLRAVESGAGGGVRDAVPEGERPLELLERLRHGGRTLRLEAGADRRRERPRRVAGAQPVVGELRRDRPRSQLRTRFEGAGARGVQAGALTERQLLVRGLLEQRMPEGVAARFGEQDVPPQGVAEPGLQLLARRSPGRLHQLVRDPPAAHGGDADHPAGRRLERVEAGEQGVAQGLRHRAGVASGEQLLRHERVAL
jgi:hypothetical protein